MTANMTPEPTELMFACWRNQKPTLLGPRPIWALVRRDGGYIGSWALEKRHALRTQRKQWNPDDWEIVRFDPPSDI